VHVIVAAVVLGQPLVALAVVVAPPVVMGSHRRWALPAVASWLLAFGCVAAWGAAGTADIDRADRTGGTGNGLAGGWWLLAAVVAAAVSVQVVRRRTRAGSPTS
jgi:hypothetical protein